MTRAPSAGTPPLQWLGWDGRVLRWRGDESAAGADLLLDGVVFERALGGGDGERRFEFSPSGHAELEFAFAAGAAPLAMPWRVRFGEPAAAGRDQWHGAARAPAPLEGTPRVPPRGWGDPPIAIVVPIHNAAASVQRCLAALARWTPAEAAWILIDDASTDPKIAPLLARWAAARRNVRVERNAVNAGYTRSVNTGIALAGDADVVLLNSDTEVGPLWLQALRAAAYSDAAFGTATAVSDNAGAFSVPELEQYCPPPPQWTLAQAQRAVLQQAGLRYPELPTGNGFCMFVKRALIERIGVMDADAFPAGYGEENDFCQRGSALGFRHAIAGNVLVRHERSASFGDARRAALGAQGMAVLRRRYPRYEADVGAALYSFSRRVLDWRVRRAYAGAAPRPRILGVAAGDADVARAFAGLGAACEPFVLVAGATLRLLAGAAAGPTLAIASADDDAGARLAAWLLAHAIEGVHCGGVAPPAALAHAAAALGLPLVSDAGALRALLDGAGA